jgi:hypothetical protein
MDISDIVNDIAGVCAAGLTVWFLLAMKRDKKRKENKNDKRNGNNVQSTKNVRQTR